jgi:hypothetical protein
MRYHEQTSTAGQRQQAMRGKKIGAARCDLRQKSL